MRRFYCGVAATGLLLSLLSCDPFADPFADIQDAILYKSTTLSTPPTSIDTLTVVTWNVRFGAGNISFYFDCFSENTVITKKQVIDNLKAMEQKIREMDPDILLLQEVDIQSKRTAYVDQLQWLLNHTDLNYGAYASMWNVEFFPHHGTGKINSGQAILSRWKINDAERIGLDLREDMAGYEQYLYIHRNILKAAVAVPDHPFSVLNIHAAAFSRTDTAKTKKKHIERFEAELDAIDKGGENFIAGGDLNSIPRWSLKVEDFPGDVCESEDLQGATHALELNWLDGLYTKYSTAIDSGDFMDPAKQALYYTFSDRPSEFTWSRKLDYLFTNLTWEKQSGMVHQNDTKYLSDHAPVSARIIMP